ncbi:hypothetical protein NUW54_g13413 [Trametes sanguinea]|uniref:Uncharacterized protein n=1 Tax=Trametes sanguinea TaxID=158606 RepID=A0ACC1ML85_9APHY|nr:hypothetical protein NUW54_g13413 [Trametes sanguinea]
MTAAHHALHDSLQPLTESIDPLQRKARHEQLMKDGDAASRNAIRIHKAAMRSLLGLTVLVQNRRKDKEPVLLFASRAQAVSQPSLTDAVMRGTAQGDNLVKFTKDRWAGPTSVYGWSGSCACIDCRPEYHGQP